MVIWFAAPIVAFVAAICFIDPYDLVGFNIVRREIRTRVADSIDPVFQRCNEYRRSPLPNVLLGDSRMHAISVERINKATGESYANMAFGGASLPEIIDAFWVVAAEGPLRRVYIGLNFDLANSFLRWNRVPEARAAMMTPILYPFRLAVVEAAYFDLYAALWSPGYELGVPDMRREDFWKRQLTVTAAKALVPYQYPVAAVRQLRAIADYAQSNDIGLAFVLPPTHVDLQRRISDYGLDSEAKRWRTDLAAIAPLYDFDYPNSLTADRENFSDPYHTRRIDVVIDEIWGESQGFARRTVPRGNSGA